MLSKLIQKLQTLATIGAISVCAAGSSTAGLFCDMQCCQQKRPYFSPACEPAWGYHQTCWRKFPELEPCSGWGDYCPSCDTGGEVIHENDYQAQMMPMPGSPVLQGSPMLIQQPMHNQQQPMHNHAQPAQNQAPQQLQNQAQPMPMPGQVPQVPNQAQPMQNYAQPMPGYPQPMPNYDAPNQGQGGQNNYNSPSTLTPIPQPEDALPQGGGMMPPIPDSVRFQQVPGNYCPVGQQQPQGYAPASMQTAYAPQGQPLANATQGLPVRAISFNRVRPASTKPVVQPKRTLLQRILPGGK